MTPLEAIGYLTGMSRLVDEGKVPACNRAFQEAVRVMYRVTRGTVALSSVLDERDHPQAIFDRSGWRAYRDVNRLLKKILNGTEDNDE